MPHPVLAWLAAREGAMGALLEALVNVDSPTRDAAAVDAAGAPLKAFFAAHGLAFETARPHPAYGETVFARAGGAGRPALLLGHRDTVFPAGEAARRPFRVAGGRGHGPGVADMKAGLAMEAFVLAGLAACGDGRPLAMLTTSDEEVASPACRGAIERAAREAACVFNAEPSRRKGGAHVVTRARKGGVFLRAEVAGKAAHSGAHYARGRSAILSLATMVPALHALTDLPRGVSVNVGTIAGGQTVNTVAPSCVAEIDLRYVAPADRAAMVEAIRACVEAPAVEGTTGRLAIVGEFLPLAETAASRSLFALYRAAGAEVGLAVEAADTGGCADSGFTAAAGCPTLCSVGPAGGGGHTPEEYVEMASLLPCAQALALTLLRLPA